jgi:peptidoglycan/LPS O-acetylase OafA/YrhL
VFLFFALSGYLLFWPFAERDFGTGSPVSLRRYALNRVVRILPLYYVAVIALLVAQERIGSFSQWWHFMLLAENFSNATIGTVDGVLWSLVVEVHFYLLLPLLAWACAAVARGSKARAALLLAGLGAASLTLWLIVMLPVPTDRLSRYNLPATFFYFVPGMLVALLRLHWREHPPRLPRLVASSDAWLVAAGVIVLVMFTDYRWGPVVIVASFLAVGACVLPLRRGRLLEVLELRWLAAVGVISYSLYVWHFPLQTHLVSIDGFPRSVPGIFTITIPLSLLAAAVSYRFVEAPFLRLRRRWSAAAASSGGRPAASAPLEP